MRLKSAQVYTLPGMSQRITAYVRGEVFNLQHLALLARQSLNELFEIYPVVRRAFDTAVIEVKSVNVNDGLHSNKKGTPRRKARSPNCPRAKPQRWLLTTVHLDDAIVKSFFRICGKIRHLT